MAEGAARYFHEAQRCFPWRNDRDPFHLAIAEILLQKTRAESVVAVYQEIIASYPVPNLLAIANVDEVAATLHSLGLSNKKAKMLVKMASAVAASEGKVLKNWKTILHCVPGLGAYAARAIACFAFGERVGIVDANVARIMRRVFRIKTTDPRSVVFQQYADAIARESDDPRETNFGLLDLGAQVCLPNPRCERCPFQAFCPRYGVD